MPRSAHLAALCAVALLLCGCSAVQPVDSSGAFTGAAPLTQLVLQASPEYHVSDANEHGDTHLGDAFVPGIQRYARAFARDFDAQFPPVLAVHGVAAAPAGPGLPVLHVRVAAHEVRCRGDRNCNVKIRLEGVLRDAAGARAWSFSDLLDPDEMDQAGFQQFLDALAAAMVRDHVIAPAGSG